MKRRAQLLDFDVAVEVRTRPNEVIGTVENMAPEAEALDYPSPVAYLKLPRQVFKGSYNELADIWSAHHKWVAGSC